MSFTQQIDQEKNGLVRYGTSIILLIILVLSYILLTMKVPIYEEFFLIENSRDELFNATISNSSQYDYISGDIIKIIIGDEDINFIIQSFDKKTNSLVLKTNERINNKSILNAKVFIGDESIIEMVLHVKLGT